MGRDASHEPSTSINCRKDSRAALLTDPRERYPSGWPGKREAILAPMRRVAKTLRPCREESVDFDTTKNLFIEGDNLDALKLLQETYLGKVKLSTSIHRITLVAI